CEIYRGFRNAIANYASTDPGGLKHHWLEGWGAKVTLLLQVDETGGLSPVVTFNTPYANALRTFPTGTVTTPQSFARGGSASLTSKETRKETITSTYAYPDLGKELAPPPSGSCANEAGILIHSDLKIGDFIDSKAFLAGVPGAVGTPTAPPYSAFTDE